MADINGSGRADGGPPPETQDAALRPHDRPSATSPSGGGTSSASNNAAIYMDNAISATSTAYPTPASSETTEATDELSPTKPTAANHPEVKAKSPLAISVNEPVKPAPDGRSRAQQLQNGTASPLSAVATSVQPTVRMPRPVASSSSLAELAKLPDGREAAHPTPLLLPGVWQRVAGYLETDREIWGLGNTCAPLKAVVLDPVFVATWLLKRSTTYLAIYNAYRKFPSILTVSVTRHMMSMGAHIPRYFALLVGFEQHELLSNFQQQSGVSSGTGILPPIRMLDEDSQKPLPPDPSPTAGSKRVPDLPAVKIHVADEIKRRARVPLDTIHYIIWVGTSYFGNLFGFDAEVAATVTTMHLYSTGNETQQLYSAKVALYKDTLGWVYNVPGAILPGSPTLVAPEPDARVQPPSDAEVFAYMMSLYRNNTVATAPEPAPAPQPKPGSIMPPGSTPAAAAETTKSAEATPVIAPASKKLWGDKSPDRQRIIASLRELANVYRFTPGLIASSLPEGWLPLDLFEQDVELAWFLIRHSGDAKNAFRPEDADEVAKRTLLGYRIHVNLAHPSLPASAADELFPYASIARLIGQRRIALTDNVLTRLLQEHTTSLTISRLHRFVDRSRITLVGIALLKECFEGQEVLEKISSGHAGIMFHRADAIVQAFGLSKAVIARCFMADPVPPPLAPTIPAPTDDETSVEAGEGDGTEAAEGEEFEDATEVEEVKARTGVSSPPNFPVIGLLTRLAQAAGFLPWVAWQWAIKQLGPSHPVASACLHDVCTRSFPPPAPINPGALEGASFARKESDAAVRTMLGMGVRTQLCTIVVALRLAQEEIESATASGVATQALRTQAATVKGGWSINRAAQQAAASATAAGARAISRRFVYVLADIEKLLLANGPDDFESGRVFSRDGRDMADALKEGALIRCKDEATGEEVMRMVPLYPAALLPQHRSVWLLALRTLIVESETWRVLTASPVSPNAGRRFYIAASNIVRGLEQFGVPAAALAALRAKGNGGGRALRSMSSSDSRETMLFVGWMDELIAEESEIQKGIGRGQTASPL
ncbi:hypothetical protein HK101_003636 [Irineochytrium annulatum]|nr:hypothetical protein HK101_003636 [Irineochytrium annulatum]